MKEGHKCLISCQCFLPQFKKQASPPAHQFIAFVTLTDNVVDPKVVQCNNCGVLHKIVDICKSEIMNGKDSSNVLMTVDDIKVSLGPNIVLALENNKADLPTWEQAQFIIENQLWGKHVILSTESDGKVMTGKALMILGSNLARVENFTRNEVF